MCVALLLSEEEANDVVEICVYHQTEEDNHAGVLCILHELVAGLATGNHFEEQEHKVTSIEGWDREDVHEGENDGDEGCHHPETIPVPLCREEATYSTEAAERGGTLLREDILEVADIALQRVPTIGNAGRNRGEEPVFLDGGCIGIGNADTYLEVLVGGDGDGVEHTCTVIYDADVVVDNFALFFLLLQLGECCVEGGPGFGGLTIDAYDVVACEKTYISG